MNKFDYIKRNYVMLKEKKREIKRVEWMSVYIRLSLKIKIFINIEYEYKVNLKIVVFF